KRAAGEIGAPLEAEVDIHAPKSDFAALNALGNELRFLLITSEARLHSNDGPMRIEVNATEAEKCARCWHRRPEVGKIAAHPELCERCVTNISTGGEKRVFA